MQWAAEDSERGAWQHALHVSDSPVNERVLGIRQVICVRTCRGYLVSGMRSATTWGKCTTCSMHEYICRQWPTRNYT